MKIDAVRTITRFRFDLLYVNRLFYKLTYTILVEVFPGANGNSSPKRMHDTKKARE
jgi:hypothetical protein